MVAYAGVHRFGMDGGRLTLRTFRDGLAAQAGHDLTIDVGRWSGEVTIADDGTPSALTATIDMTSLVVREGTGGLKPLTDKDKRDIISTARKALSADRFPEAKYAATGSQPASEGGVINGTLTLAGQSRPLRLLVSPTGPDAYRATTSIVQTDYGIKPYSGFFGALKLKDTVEVEISVDLSEPGSGLPGAGA